jgi:aspartyl/asparaginyl-tRNA synthetase
LCLKTISNAFEAIDILEIAHQKKKSSTIINEWGADLQSEHERYLVEKHFKCPIFFDYQQISKHFAFKRGWKNSSRHGHSFPG